MYLNEEDAFWALVILIGSPKFAMHGMLIPGLPKLLAYCDYHATMRKRFVSRLDRHLVSVVMYVCDLDTLAYHCSDSRCNQYTFVETTLNRTQTFQNNY